MMTRSMELVLTPRRVGAVAEGSGPDKLVAWSIGTSLHVTGAAMEVFFKHDFNGVGGTSILFTKEAQKIYEIVYLV